MRESTLLVAALIGIAMVVSGCQPSPTAPPLVEEPADAASEDLPGASAKGGKGKPSGGSAGVEMQGGMNGASQQVPIQNDSSRELNVQGPYAASIDMTATHGGRASCTVLKGNPSNAEKEALLEKLLDPLQDRFRMVMVVDRQGSDHRLTLNFDDDDSALERVVLNVTDGPTVFEGPQDTFQFSGGNVRISDRRGKVKDYVKLTCPNLDSITVVLDRGGS